MRVVVCTIVHHPADARIYHRQIRALLDAGHEVTYIAPVDSQDFQAERIRFPPRESVTPDAPAGLEYDHLPAELPGTVS